VSIHKLRRQLTAANKRLKWYEAHFESYPSTRRRCRAYLRRIMERDNIRLRLAMERARVPAKPELDLFAADPERERRRGFHIPFYLAPPRALASSLGGKE
jgi:hypothetical protein